MIHKVQVETQIDKDTTVAHHFEQVVDTPEEAKEFGEKCNYLMMAFLEGWVAGDNG